MIRDEIWSVSMDRILAFFNTQPDIVRTAAGYQYRDCQITVQALTPKTRLGLEMAQTQVTFTGDAQSVSDIYHRFFIQFLTAGG